MHSRFLLLLMFAGIQAEAVTIGAGPAIGTDKRGTVWYEEFQDWTHEDLRGLEAGGDGYAFGDGQDRARDLVAFYCHEQGDEIVFRADVLDLGFGSENGSLDLYAAIDCADGGQVWLPDFTDTRADPAHPWEVCISLYSSSAAVLYDADFGDVTAGNWLGSYWRSDLDGVEFGIARGLLMAAGWDGSRPLHIQVFTVRDGAAGELPGSDLADFFGTLDRNTGDGTGVLTGGVLSSATTGRARYAAIAHANQSLGTQGNTQGHIYTDRSDIGLYPGFVRALDSHQMLGAPLNMHLSGSLISSLLWAEQNPDETGYPDRDGPAFLARIKAFIDTGVGSKIGGVYAEHMMPYFEGEVNRASIRAYNGLVERVLDLTASDMGVMHVPERVIHSNTNWPYAVPGAALAGKPFADILAGGYVATYLDEVTHLHGWFYPNETANPGWDDAACGRWAGGRGNDEEPYHHKIHRINGVYCFMINDREDQSKFGPFDGGMALDTRSGLLDKARSPDQEQLTIVFDDWEAFAGNSFTSPTPNHNADQWHATLRWAANHPWIEITNLKDILALARGNPAWVIDHGHVYDKSMETYEWLKRASEHGYDHWYYGGALEENFSARVPGTAPDGSSRPGTKPYGDLNTPGSLLHDAWATVHDMPAGALRELAEFAYVSMIYETAWHDEDANSNQYKSRNYQVTFDRGPADGNCDISVADTTYDACSGWALKLQGHTRKVGVFADAQAWLDALRAATQTEATVVEAKDVDDDVDLEYVLRNRHAYVCIERWGARVIAAFAYDKTTDRVHQLIGAFAANPAEEHDGEGMDNLRCSAFKDRFATGPGDGRYTDMDFAASAPVAGPDFWEFRSADGHITKRLTLPGGWDALGGRYTLSPFVGTLYMRFGLGPNQLDLLHHGAAHLAADVGPTRRGLRNSAGGAVYVVRDENTSFSTGALPGAGWSGRELPLTEQVEIAGSETAFSVWLAFSRARSDDLDGDGLDNESERAVHGTDWTDPDSDDDGMGDGYEVDNGLLPLTDDAGLDRDADGQSNLEEFFANTRAGDADSLFRITDLLPQADATEIRFSTAPDRTYRIVFRDQALASLWTPFQNPGDGVGTWRETGTVETNRSLRDTFLPGTSGAPPLTGHRDYRIQLAP